MTLTINAQPTEPSRSSWSIRLSGAIQHGGDDWVFWYEDTGSSATIYDDHLGLNGVQGASYGIDISLEHRIAKRMALALCAGYIPTRLHAEVHYPVPDQSILEVEAPKARMPYCPVRLSMSYDLVRKRSWRLYAGLQGGVGLYRSTDVHLNVGRSRRFYGKGSMLVGGQVGADLSIANGFSITSILQYQRTSFHVEELYTGDLKQTNHFKPLSLSTGLQYTFGRR
jgi:hypothetical protein